jgi:hypothetical protein
MISFSQFILERFLNPGFNEKHEPYREKHRQDVHDMLRKSYADIGGYGELGSGSEEESKAIHHDITHSDMKLVRSGGKIVSVTLYKKHKRGRKVIAAGTDGTTEGKKGLARNIVDDIKQKNRNAWGEFSGKLGHIWKKTGADVIPSSEAEKLLSKKVTIKSPTTYEREIGGKPHVKTILGNPKRD